MTGGLPLGAPAPEPRKRGRPKGSGNKRAKDLRGFIEATYGGSAALQMAKLCMVTPAELKAAGGSMGRAMVAKAAQLVDQVRAAQADRDDWLRQVVRGELEHVAASLGDDDAKELRRVVGAAVKRIGEAAAGFGLREALDMLARERAALLPYTDQKQPLALDLNGKNLAPSVVVMSMGDGGGDVPALPVENTQVFEGVYEVVSPGKSHGDGQAADSADLFGSPAAD